jgi:fructosamine-3-kinase
MIKMLTQIENIIDERIISHKALGGGSIADANVITTESGKKYFIKSYRNKSSILQTEANGLKELEKSKAIRIPKVIAITDDYLILEFIKTGKAKNRFSKLFGKQFAEMHKTKSDRFGFYENNYIGSTQQINLPQNKNWIEFFWEYRLLFQFKLAEQNGYVNSEFKILFKKLEIQFPKILEGTEEEPTLLHGDLWSGNFMVDENGNPVLIDPAVYYGNREADIAMTKLFGGFDAQFYSAYDEAYPLLDDWEYRIDLYKLYHVLNHLNLFGSGYYSQAISIIKKYV